MIIAGLESSINLIKLFIPLSRVDLKSYIAACQSTVISKNQNDVCNTVSLEFMTRLFIPKFIEIPGLLLWLAW